MDANRISQTHLLHWLEEMEAPYDKVAVALSYKAKRLPRKLDRFMDDIIETKDAEMIDRSTEDERELIWIAVEASIDHEKIESLPGFEEIEEGDEWKN